MHHMSCQGLRCGSGEGHHEATGNLANGDGDPFQSGKKATSVRMTTFQWPVFPLLLGLK